MKNKLTLLSIAFFLISGLFAQAPDLINYQAVARDATGIPLLSQPVNVTFDIRQGSSSGTVVYSETHASNTNPFGLVNLQIGGGTPVSGTFAGINWGTGLYYLQVTVNGNVMPASQLLSVPYALHANTASSGTPGANGHNGLSAITSEPAGSNCPNGGYLVEVGVDDNDDGTLQALEIDFSYYVCNGLDGAANNNDTSATNELQMLSISNDTIYLSNGGFVKLPPALGDNWGSQVVVTSGANILGDGTTLNPLMVIDNDSSSTNEIQNLSIAGNTINISGGTGFNLSAVAPSTGEYLYWNGLNWVSQAPAANTDNQNLINGGKSGNMQTVNIQNGTGVTFSVADGDSLATNEIQQLTFTNPSLSLSLGGGTVNLSGLNTDAQTLSYTAATQSLSISNGNTVILDVNDLDADPTNEYNTSFGINGTNLELVDGGNTFQVPLSTLSDGDWTVSGNDLLNANTGNVGIGPMFGGAPGFLSTNGKALTVATTNVYNSTSPATIELVGSNTSAFAPSGRLAFGHITAGPTAVYEGGLEMNIAGEMMFFTNGANERMKINSAGNVGIGIATPTEKLHVFGNIRMEDGTDYLDVRQSGTSTALISNNLMELLPNGGGVSFSIDDGDANFYVTGHMNNGLQIIDGNQALNRVLVSDASGNASWTDLSAVASGATAWTKSGTNIFQNVLTDKVGIGTSTPAVQLDVYTNSSVRSAQFVQDFSSTTNKYGLYALAQGAGTGTNYGVSGEALNGATNIGVRGRAFGGAGNYSGYFDLGDVYIADNLGVGTTSAIFPLHVNTTTDDRAGYFINSTNSNSATGKFGVYALASGSGTGDNQGGWFDASGTATGINYGVAGQALGSAGENRGVYGSASGSFQNWAGYFDLGDVNINNNTYIGGNLLVGTVPSIQAKAQVNGTGYSWAFKILGGGSNTPVFAVQTSTGNTIIGNTTATPANTLDVEGSMAIGSTYSGTNAAPANGLIVEGSVSIGSASINSLYKAQITSATHQYGLYSTITRPAGSNYGLRGTASSTGGTFNVGVYATTTGAATTNYGLYGTASGASTNWALYAAGNSYTTAGAWTPSDERLKTNIQSFEGAINKLNQLEVKTYLFDQVKYPTMNFSKQKQYGIMAQNLEQVFPEMVMDTKHSVIDKEGNLSEEMLEIKAVNYDQLIPVLVKAVQEQQKMIEELKQEIDALKNN